jgi:methyltransferase (TIGR00027 family)
VQNERASRTAVLIAASLVLLHRDPKFSDLVSATSSNLYERMLYSSTETRLFSMIVQQRWFLKFAAAIERLTIPGIVLHYALRKKCIARLARNAFGGGATQMVVIGAGLDSLALELHQEFPRAHFWEIDHPATQRYKLAALTQTDSKRFHLVPVDLSVSELTRNTLAQTEFDPNQRTLWVAEGIMMYLSATGVSSLMERIRSLCASGSQFIFTFMETLSDGRISFRNQSKLVDWWLARRHESFTWGIKRNGLQRFIQPWRISRIFDESDLRELTTMSPDIPLAAGELICLAEIQ